MAGGVEKILRRRISSVESTKKITRAMELIATTRVVKAQQKANASRPYAEKITQVIEDLAAQSSDNSHPLFGSSETSEKGVSEKVGVVIICSDRGLAGPYNSQVIRAAETELLEAKKEGKEYLLITIGKKAKDYFSFRNYNIAESYEKISDTPTYENAKEVANTIKDLFLNKEVDEVRLVYTEFITLGRQKTVVRSFLPLLSLDAIASENVGNELVKEPHASFEFEPSPDEILETLLHRYIESRLFSALLDSAASEHANRQRAMKAATDNAEELITSLTRRMNRARQDAITTEIMEIVGGAEALKEGNQEDLEELIVNN